MGDRKPYDWEGFWFFETGLSSMALAVLELGLPESRLFVPPSCWDLLCAPPHPAGFFLEIASHTSPG